MLRSYKTLILFLFLGLWMSGCATVPEHRPVTMQENVLKDLCEHNHIQWQWDGVTQTFVLKRNNMTAKCLVGSNLVIMDREKIVLSDILKRIDNNVMVPYDFKSRIISQFISIPSYGLGKFNTIVIDAGHGGKDSGTKGRSGLQEKKVVLDIARRLKKNFEEKGIKVKMIRDRDEFISLPERTQMTSRSKADLFISIHANSSPDRSVRGVEVYSLRELSYRDKLEPQRKENEQTMFKNFAMKRNSEDLQKIISDMLYTYKQSESELLASYVAGYTSKLANSKNRGSKASGFYVLRNTLIPAILVEVGFLSNTNEERLFTTSFYRQKIADAITKSIFEYASRH